MEIYTYDANRGRGGREWKRRRRRERRAWSREQALHAWTLDSELSAIIYLREWRRTCHLALSTPSVYADIHAWQKGIFSFFLFSFIYLFIFFSIVSKDYRRLYTKRQSKKSCDNSRLPLILADGNAVSALSDVTFVGERTIISINRNPLLPPLFIAHAFEFAHESSIRPSFRLFASFRSKFRA